MSTCIKKHEIQRSGEGNFSAIFFNRALQVLIFLLIPTVLIPLTSTHKGIFIFICMVCSFLVPYVRTLGETDTIFNEFTQ